MSSFSDVATPAAGGALRPGLPRPGGHQQRAEICDKEEESAECGRERAVRADPGCGHHRGPGGLQVSAM